MANKEVEASSRYNRQELIDGWNQERLDKARVVIVGSGNLSNFTAASLVALGIGNVEVYDNAKVNGNRQFLMHNAKEGEPRVKALEGILKQINPLSKVKGVSMSLDNKALVSMLGKPDIIIDASNSPESKANVYNYATSKEIPIISASADDVRAELHVNEEGKLEEYKGQEQGNVPSEVMAGLIAEETRKIIMPMGDEKPVKQLGYSTASSRRFSDEKEFEVDQVDLKDKRVLIIGAGALGNFVALGMGMSGVGNIDILDFDEVDSTNLNRQILFYDAVGEKKAEALAKRVKEIAPESEVRGLVEKLDEKSTYFEKNKPDLILDCVDSFAVRGLINYFSVRNEIPLVSGGTNPNSGQVTVYVPGKSACLDCRLGVDKALAEERAAASCRHAPDPSVIMANEIVGGMVVGEALKVLDNGYGEPITRILKYDAKAGARGGLIGAGDACDCKRPDVKQWLKDIAKQYGGKK